ncbi:hypothetical protein [Lentzea sp. NBRC 105346]|uniref:hypothetical protein n=1 Tax=Lentzea sp. NBRC 105346 TaxID=3032205 RepID=UPI0025539EC8|nr:hypothetical protein [Lentzea sp. NBRC 105346]
MYAPLAAVVGGKRLAEFADEVFSSQPGRFSSIKASTARLRRSDCGCDGYSLSVAVGTPDALAASGSRDAVPDDGQSGDAPLLFGVVQSGLRFAYLRIGTRDPSTKKASSPRRVVA